jgi:RNA polymerase sigma factor (TIGR02999 family)
MAAADVTQLLVALSEGRDEALDDLFPLIYEELREVAHLQLRRQRPGHTLNTTALVHEAYFKLVGNSEVAWQNRSHFLAVAARAMRQVLINYARQRMAQKRGGGADHVTFEDEQIHLPTRPDVLLDLDEALQRLEAMDARQSKVVELRFFGGLTIAEAADVLDVSTMTVKRDWRLARAWLSQELKRGEGA